MKKTIYCILAALLFLTATDMTAQTFKLSGDLRELLTRDAATIRRAADSQSRISLLMKVTDASQMAPVCADYDMKMITDLGYIAVVAVPVDQIAKAASDPRVVRMEQEGRYELKLDDTRTVTNVDAAYKPESPLTTAYTGKGVIVGVIDMGVQFDHPTFQDTNGQIRFRKVWDRNQDGSEVVLTDPAAIKARQYSYASKYGEETSNHASHVVGIAAGAGSANAAKYRGMAPESDIIYYDFLQPAVKDFTKIFNDYSANLVTAISKMMEYAQEHNQPIVINMSLGQNRGFSTDVKLSQEAFGLLTGPGRILVAANGNEGAEKSYVHSGDKRDVTIVFTPTGTEGNTEMFWRSGGKLTFKLTFAPINGGSTITEEFNTTQLVDGMLPPIVRDNYELRLTQLDDAPDGRKVYKMAFYPKAEIVYNLTANITSEQAFDLYSLLSIDSSKTPTSGITVSTAYSAGVPAIFPNVIGVGNYTSRKIPSDQETTNKTMDNSSSWGPTWDERTKPDVTAPGSIISSGNWYYEENVKEIIESYDIPGSDVKETWVGMSGTSMASPAVAGIVALWLQAKPDLTPSDVLAIIKKTSQSIKDPNDKDYPENQQGNGMINAYAGLCEILKLPTAISNVAANRQQDDNYYDLQGRRLGTQRPTQKGLYIRGNRKTMVK
jgi:subtilisin family serine protease